MAKFDLKSWLIGYSFGNSNLPLPNSTWLMNQSTPRNGVALLSASEPVISESTGDGYHLYNNVKFKGISEYVSGFEYSCISEPTEDFVNMIVGALNVPVFKYLLVVNKAMFKYVTSSNKVMSREDSAYKAFYYSDSDDWVLIDEDSSGDSAVDINCNKLVWTNADITIDDGEEVYLPKSYPISLEGLTLFEIDFSNPIIGVPTVSIAGRTYYKVSDMTPTIEQFYGAYAVNTDVSLTTLHLTKSYVLSQGGSLTNAENYWHLLDLCFATLEENVTIYNNSVDEGVLVAEPGFYSCSPLIAFNPNKVPSTLHLPSALLGWQEGNLVSSFARTAHDSVVYSKSRSIISRDIIGFFIHNGITSLRDYAFFECNNLTGVLCSKVTQIGEGAFSHCTSLVSATFPELSVITDAQYVFSYCTSLVRVSLPKLARISSSNCFLYCSSLQKVDTPPITNLGSGCFFGCVSLTNDSVDLSAVTSLSYSAFGRCTGLTNLKFPAAETIANPLTNTTGGLSEHYLHGTFENCTNLWKLDFSVLNTIGNRAFYGCILLDTLIIRTTTKCTLNSINAFTNTPIEGNGNGYIYVPSSLILTYQADSKWSNFSHKFRAIEDYPDICS